MRLIAILLALFSAALVLGTSYYMYFMPDRHEFSSAMVQTDGADIGGDFTLQAADGQEITSQALIDRPSLIYFGYTFCPDICPIDTQVMADVTDLLAKDGIDVKPVFITVDPDRDTPEVLAEYTAAIHPKMVGLTGTPAQIRAAADAYKVYYQKAGDGPDYTMNHTGFMYLVTPDKGVIGLFRRGNEADTIAIDIKLLLESS